MDGHFRYLLHYVLSYTQNQDIYAEFIGFAIVCLLVGFIGLGECLFLPYVVSVAFLVFHENFQTEIWFCLVGRVYLGMHSLIDVICGLFMGLAILAFWLAVHEDIDEFIVSGKNGM